MPPARDSGEALAVEGGASGAAAAFDGNLTRDILSWLFPDDSWGTVNHDAMVAELMLWTESGHLAWVCFPPKGFRL